MALDFDSLPPEKPVPDKPPSQLVWTVVFFVLTLVGVFVVLMLWPAGEPTHTPWFWTCVTVFPTGVAAIVVTRPFSMHEGRRLDALAWNTAAKRYAEDAFAKESIPLLVLGAAVRVSEGGDKKVDEKVADGTLKLEPLTSDCEDSCSIAARWLQPIGARLAADDPERHELVLEWLYEQMLTGIHAPLAALPVDLPISVLLDLSGYVGNVDALTLWRTKWSDRELRPAYSSLVPQTLDLMAIDSWLDDRNGPLHRHAVLVISISLGNVIDETPRHGSAEAGVGLLLASSAVVAKFALHPTAAFHRPLRSDNANLDHALTHALRWGSVELGSVGALWTTGFNGDSIDALHASLSHLKKEKEQGEVLPEFDLDRAVGYAGHSAGWMAAACASSHVERTSMPQLLAQRFDDHTYIATVATIENNTEFNAHRHEPAIQA
jgi:hypothetical protein